MTELGWVYCLSNPSYKTNYFKIGYTKRKDPLTRIKELNSSTGVPTNFELVFAKKVKQFKEKEALIHKLLGDCRINKNREFFKCNRYKLEAIFSLMDGDWYLKDIRDPLYRPIKTKVLNKSKKKFCIDNNINFIKLNITLYQKEFIQDNFIIKHLPKKRRNSYESILTKKNTFLILYYPKKDFPKYSGFYGIYKLIKTDINKNLTDFRSYTSLKTKNFSSVNRNITKEIKLMLKDYDEYIFFLKPLNIIKLNLPNNIFKNSRIGAIKNTANITYLTKLLK